MSAPRPITPEDLALYAMQLLSKDETSEAEAYLEQSEDARTELARIQGDLALYAHTVDLQSPPAFTRERLMRQVAREKKTVPIDRSVEIATSDVETRDGSNDINDQDSYKPLSGRGMGGGRLTEDDLPKPSVARKVFPWIGWAAAAGLAVAVGDLYREQQSLQTTVVSQAMKMDHLSADAAAARQVLDALTDNSAMRVTLTRGNEAPAPQGRATYIANKGTLIFVANNLEPLPPEKTYELWLIPAAEGHDPIPAGTFRPDGRGNASIILPPLPKGVEAKAFGVTIEDKDGASTPTLPIILVGA